MLFRFLSQLMTIGITDTMLIYNEAAEGGTFFVDRIELREMPIRE